MEGNWCSGKFCINPVRDVLLVEAIVGYCTHLRRISDLEETSSSVEDCKIRTGVVSYIQLNLNGRCLCGIEI